MPATLEAPAAPVDAEIAALEAQLPAEVVSGLNEHLANLDAAADDAATTPPETPAPAATAVEPPDATPETPVDQPNAKAETTAPKETVPPPASWQPDEVAMQAAKNLGVPNEVVRGIRTQEDFYRTLQMAAAMRAPTVAASPPAPETPQEPSALERFLNDPLQDGDQKAAIKALMERDAQREQQLQQLAQGSQAHQEQLAQQRFREVEQLFDQQLDTLGFDTLGKAESQTPDQTALRGKVFQTLFALGQAGLVRDVSSVSIKQALALAMPDEFEQHLRRQTVSAARSQADQRLTAGRTAAPPLTPPVEAGPASDPQVAMWLEKAKRGELTRDG